MLKFELNLYMAYVLQIPLWQISFVLYSQSLDIWQAKPPRQGLPASCTSQSVQAG